MLMPQKFARLVAIHTVIISQAPALAVTFLLRRR